MSGIGKYWKAILAVLMIAAAILVYSGLYVPAKKSYEAEQSRLNLSVMTLQSSITRNQSYAAVAADVPDAVSAVEESRLELYQHFPKELREEDQLTYLIDLEQEFGGEDGSGELGFTTELYAHFLQAFNVRISFSFGQAEPIYRLSDGAILMGQTITVYFTGGYENVKNMIQYLATDSRLTSIQYATMQWSGEDLTGSFTLQSYLMNSDRLEYQPPELDVPDTGKQNIFDLEE